MRPRPARYNDPARLAADARPSHLGNVGRTERERPRRTSSGVPSGSSERQVAHVKQERKRTLGDQGSGLIGWLLAAAGASGQSTGWEYAAPLSGGRIGMAAAVYTGKIHVFGGYDCVQYLDTHQRYDPSADQWQDLAPLPVAPAIPVL